MRLSPYLYALLPLFLASCGARFLQDRATPNVAKAVTPTEPTRGIPRNAAEAGVRPGPSFESLVVSPDNAARALQAFRLSCPALVRRQDASGLTQGKDWTGACAAAEQWPEADAKAFFREQFDMVRVGEGSAFATGYYEPEIAGSRVAAPGYAVPIYKRPKDLIEVDLGLFAESLKGRRIRGRVKDSLLVPYADRAEIEAGWLAGRGLELAWAADPVEFFFLQVQGSGRLLLPDGRVMRIGYDGQNGRDYTAIGRVMRERGLLQPGELSMQGIMAWLRANPEQGRAIMNENKSWVFFKELTGPGPLGALALPVTPQGTVAADPLFVPLGAPVFLETERPEANGLWVAQDTGGAIKGPNRFDTFWGAGEQARQIAGGMAARGSALVLLPRGVMTRLQQEAGRAGPPPQP